MGPEGLRMTLTEDFQEQTVQGYTASYVDAENTVVIFVLQEKFSLMEGLADWSLEDYADAVRKNAPATAGKVRTERGIAYFDYQFTNTELNLEYYYYTAVFKGEDCFWMVQLSCLAKDKKTMQPRLAEYARSVELN